MGVNMLNDKMHAIAKTIEEVIIHTLPVEYQLFLFEGKITLEDIVGQVLVECCKQHLETHKNISIFHLYETKQSLITTRSD